MAIIDLLHTYHARFLAKHGAHMTSEQWSALNAMLGCRTGQYGQIALQCDQCDWSGYRPISCGHRACRQCQHHTTHQWLERQQAKLLPVNYFMVTFTLPAELRPLAKAHPKRVYGLMFQVATETLQIFARNHKHLAGDLGVTHPLPSSRLPSAHPLRGARRRH